MIDLILSYSDTTLFLARFMLVLTLALVILSFGPGSYALINPFSA